MEYHDIFRYASVRPCRLMMFTRPRCRYDVIMPYAQRDVIALAYAMLLPRR